ncbi:hypothetical protein RND81_03G010800 [Saponaria officinalis]|uniref:DUF4283 domain-containing protein n=1 Tax=Saponaria officinalis TaxID=3572 RepID=A0AAW1M6L3_SAPOF
MSLFFFEESRNSRAISIEVEDFVEELKLWSFTLMGNVLGAKPSFKQTVDFVHLLLYNIIGEGVQFRFSTLDDMNNVLKARPWRFGAHSLILKQWSPTFLFEMDRV